MGGTIGSGGINDKGSDNLAVASATALVINAPILAIQITSAASVAYGLTIGVIKVVIIFEAHVITSEGVVGAVNNAIYGAAFATSSLADASALFK